MDGNEELNIKDVTLCVITARRDLCIEEYIYIINGDTENKRGCRYRGCNKKVKTRAGITRHVIKSHLSAEVKNYKPRVANTLFFQQKTFHSRLNLIHRRVSFQPRLQLIICSQY